ncbi:hypothetical protein AX16_006935 [Volvariella volvacea WC 439]|nr:hypothetical protein AX16_006935 [Volvariella volvacea WC 439]
MDILDLSFDTQTDPDLSDLAPRLYQINELANVSAFNLEFLNYENRTESLPSDTVLGVVEQNTSGRKLLVVRYPLSNSTIVVNLCFLGAPAEVRLPHTTGVWYMLLSGAWREYERLQEDVVDQETKKKTIDREFTFNDLVKRTEPDSENEIAINLFDIGDVFEVTINVGIAF